MIELRASVATLACHFDFTKVGLGADERGKPIVGAHGILEAKSYLYIVSIALFPPSSGEGCVFRFLTWW